MTRLVKKFHHDRIWYRKEPIHILGYKRQYALVNIITCVSDLFGSITGV